MKGKDKHHQIMQTFTEKTLPDLDVCVLGALEFFMDVRLPRVRLPKHRQMLVVGSGNALAAGRIMFAKEDAVFADESTYQEKIKRTSFDLAVIVSASGGKHALLIAKVLKAKQISTILFTSNEHAAAKPFVKHVLVFPKQREPYTYNTSTYLGMILSVTREDPRKIYNHLLKIEKRIPRHFKNYNAFYVIVPGEFDAVREMVSTKFDELFGSMVSGRVFTREQTKHARTVTNSTKELFISFGEKNTLFGLPKNRVYIPLPPRANAGAMIATSYFVIGKIQKAHPPYFKKNIGKYVKETSKVFNSKIEVVVA